MLDVLGPLAAVQATGLRRELGAPNSADVAKTFSAAGEVAIGTTRSPESDSSAPPSRSGDYNRLWQALGFDPTAMDQLVERTGLTPANLSSMLLAMELDGRVAVKHGRYFRIG